MVKKLVWAAMFVAIYVVLDFCFSWTVGQALRISLTLLPVALAGALLGWQYGALVGMAGDLLMFFLKNSQYGAYIPELTIGVMAVGVIFGLLLNKKGEIRKSFWVRVIVAQVIATWGVSILWDTWALSFHYATPFYVNLLSRLPANLVKMVILILLEGLMITAIKNGEKSDDV